MVVSRSLTLLHKTTTEIRRITDSAPNAMVRGDIFGSGETGASVWAEPWLEAGGRAGVLVASAPGAPALAGAFVAAGGVLPGAEAGAFDFGAAAGAGAEGGVSGMVP